MASASNTSGSTTRTQVRWLANWGPGNVFSTSAEIREIDESSAFVELPFPCRRERLLGCQMWISALVPELGTRLILIGTVRLAGWNMRHACEGVELCFEECPPVLHAFLARSKQSSARHVHTLLYSLAPA